VIRKILNRIERSGFFLFFLALFLLAIGITQEIDILRNIGIVILVLILLTVIVRARREISGKPRRPQSTDDPKPH
jgi:hypothetical protein